MSTLRERLRRQPTFPADLPRLDPTSVPEDPESLLLSWLDEAIAASERQANAMTLTTIGDDGRPANRTLIIKDVDERGLHFSSSRRSRKAAHLAARPYAGMLFFWRPLGRQLEIGGEVVALDDATSAEDWRQRPAYDGHDNPDWQVWALQPDRFEFLQATADRKHVRVEYTRATGGWSRRQLFPSELVR